MIVTGSLGLLLLSVVTLVGHADGAPVRLAAGAQDRRGRGLLQQRGHADRPAVAGPECGDAALALGLAPSLIERRLLAGSAVAGLLTGSMAAAAGERNLFTLVVLGCAGFAVSRVCSAWWLDVAGPPGELARRHGRGAQGGPAPVRKLSRCILDSPAWSWASWVRRWGPVRQQVVMQEGETIDWGGYTVRLAKTREFAVTDKLIADVQLEVARRGQHVCTLFPARHFHRQQNQWTTEVAIHSTWSRDLYTILHGAAAFGRRN